jgi:uncharacterized membrane protein YgdD (TMEM256/DUF423 family)
MCSSNCWLTTGALLAGLAVAAGAFGAHGLDRQFYAQYAEQTYEKKVTVKGRETVVSQVPLAQKYLADFKTGAEYQMYHGLALLVVGLLAQTRPSRRLTVAGFCFVVGILGFSGGLYAYTLTGQKWIGQFIVPVGGVLFLVGWAALALAVCARPK